MNALLFNKKSECIVNDVTKCKICVESMKCEIHVESMRYGIYVGNMKYETCMEKNEV